MPTVTSRWSEVRVLGTIHQGIAASYVYKLSPEQAQELLHADPETRGYLVYALAGDFARVSDYELDTEDGIVVPWARPESEDTYFESISH